MKTKQMYIRDGLGWGLNLSLGCVHTPIAIMCLIPSPESTVYIDPFLHNAPKNSELSLSPLTLNYLLFQSLNNGISFPIPCNNQMQTFSVQI